MPRIILIALSLASCAVTTASAMESFSFASRDWLKPSFPDLGITVQVDQIGPDLYALRHTLPVAGDSLPPILTTFNACVASKLAAQHQYRWWALGHRTGKQQSGPSREVELVVAFIVPRTEPPAADSTSNPIRWSGGVVNTDTFRPACERMFRPELMWPERLTPR